MRTLHATSASEQASAREARQVRLLAQSTGSGAAAKGSLRRWGHVLVGLRVRCAHPLSGGPGHRQIRNQQQHDRMTDSSPLLLSLFSVGQLPRQLLRWRAAAHHQAREPSVAAASQLFRPPPFVHALTDTDALLGR